MKNINKKLVSIFAMIITISLALTSVYAQATPFSICDDIEFEYTYTGMSAEKAKMIIAKEKGEVGKMSVTPKGIFTCILGHSLQTGTIDTTYHRPCKKVTTKYSYCTRTECNYTKTISESTRLLSCH